MIPELRYLRHEERLNGFTTLETRRLRGDKIVFKILKTKLTCHKGRLQVDEKIVGLSINHVLSVFFFWMAILLNLVKTFIWPPGTSRAEDPMNKNRSFKILNGHEDIDRHILFKLKVGSRTRGPIAALDKEQCRLDVRKYSFSQMMMNV